MKTSLRLAAALALQLAGGAGLTAQEGTISVSGDPQPLVIQSATPGLSPDPAQDVGTTYSLTASEVSAIEARLDAPLPAGVQLQLRLTPPPGGVSAGAVALSTSPRLVVTSIPAGSYGGLTIQYELVATVAAGVVSMSTRQVIFTITTAP